jgi:hypothetical protein
MTRLGGRARLAAVAGPLLLLATACTAEKDAQHRAVVQARERNAVAGAAVALLVTLVLRHLAGWHSRRRARRRAARVTPTSASGLDRWGEPLPGWGAPPRGPVPPWLAAAAVTTEVVASGVLLGAGALLGYAFGPVPGPDPYVFSDLLWLVVAVLIVPTAAVLAGIAILVQTVAARLPDVGLGTLLLLGAPHAALGGYALTGAFREHSAGSFTGGGLVVAFALVGVVGFWGEAARRVRARGAGRR